MRRSFKPRVNENRMNNVGDVEAAREAFLEGANTNLDFLLQNRFGWMNKLINDGSIVMEVGCGTGLSQRYINENILLTDVVERDWVSIVQDATDMKDIDADSVDVIIASHCIHHMAYPVKFFQEASRVLRPGGYILVNEINTSWLMKLILRAMKHEGWDYDVDPWSSDKACNLPDDPWSANCAIPQLIFASKDIFERQTKNLTLEIKRYSEVFTFPLSGGVVAKTKVPKLPLWFLMFAGKIDSLLSNMFPRMFALAMRVVIRKSRA